MATQKERRPASGTYSLDSGKYYFLVEASMTSSSIVCKIKLVVTDTFKKTHRFQVKSDYILDPTISAKAKKTYSMGSFTVRDSQSVPKIRFYADGKSVASIAAGTIAYTSGKPKAPNSIRLDLVNDARIDITVYGTEYGTVPTNSIIVERCKDVRDSSSFSAIPNSPFNVSNPANGYVLSVTDQSSDIERGHRYWYRARAHNNTSNKNSANIYSNAIYTTSNNDALTGSISAVRNSNNSVTVSWEISSVAYVNNRLVTRFVVYRSTNSGAYTQVGEVAADTAHTQYSYTDDTCTPDNYYKYTIKADGSGSISETFASETDIVYMTPCRPQSLSAAHDSGGDVIVTIGNVSNTATHVCIERRLDGGAWTSIAEEDYVAGGQTYSDDSAAAEDSIEYRVRNKCEHLSGTDMYSEYITSSTVIEKSRPNPPTLKTPVSGSSFLLDEGSVRLVWQHNSTDGSSQELARLRHRVNSGSWTSVSLTDESYYTLSIASGYSAGDVISWQVQTRGAFTDDANGGYSDWSETFTVEIITRPELVFTEPDNGDVISSLPVDLQWSYSDLSGTLEALTVEVKKDNVTQAAFDVPVGTGESGVYEYSLAGFLFENDSVYGLTATALSSTGFSSQADIAVTIAYEETSLEGGLIPTVDFDEDGIATVVIERDITPDEDTGDVPEPADIAEAYLYRVHDGERILVASGLEEGSQIEDRYAPINVPFTYELLMLTSDGEVSIVAEEYTQRSGNWFVYWGEDNIARARWNPEGTVSLKRPEKTRVRYSGRKYEVSYDSDAMEETFSFSSIITDRDELNNFRQMMRDGGQGIWKSANGEVYDADLEFQYQADYSENRLQWSCTLDVTRIDGG